MFWGHRNLLSDDSRKGAGDAKKAIREFGIIVKIIQEFLP